MSVAIAFWSVADSVIWNTADGPTALNDDGAGVLEIILDEHRMAWVEDFDPVRSSNLADLSNQLIAARQAVKQWRRAAMVKRETGS